MKIKNIYPIVTLLIIVFVSSCTNYKKVPYLQTIDSTYVDQQKVTYDARIMPNDLLTITVNARDSEASEQFNLFFPTRGHTTSGSLGAQSLQKYLVDNQGMINFPTVGMLRVQGMTRREAEALILSKINSNFKESPIVIVSFSDYKISVLGEVNRPGTFTVQNEKVNIFQALSLAGDMTIYGKRDNVKLIREHADGKKEIITLNLNDQNLLNSPDYYLLQNDVLYVEPNKAKAQGAEIGSMTTLTFSGVSILISITNLIINLSRR
ncbi:MAG: polysaccharide export protein [Porphyromonadaceae bacterium]|nr:polysaccharide export protein [Porphyromonadaceae bacterium]